ncbi:MAG: hypothetical protein BEN19_05045 [Epulopiscium sp. Nuni2H_MBin003]|nr:MAG: hypothetical protein BEN19_05045 [Epulopiscium sp. Nuni2H_MBin003]
MQEEDKIEISRSEYEKLKEIEEQTRMSREKPFSLYDKVNISVKVLDFVIIGGIFFIILLIIIGVLA